MTRDEMIKKLQQRQKDLIRQQRDDQKTPANTTTAGCKEAGNGFAAK
jgi:hypothetical protein